MQRSDVKWIREKRNAPSCSNCTNTCLIDCPCNCTSCFGTDCPSEKCNTTPSCAVTITSMSTIPIIDTTIDDYSITDTTAVDYTTLTTSQTRRSTSSYPHRQPVDECGDICYPSNVPNNTTLVNCTLSFRGLIPDTWYAFAIQVKIFLHIVIDD